jgi:ABC-type oligopeptide transport system ATPase subunit
MNPKLIVAALLVAALPAYAQAQKPGAAKVTKADAQKVVSIISADKAKAQAYCDMAKLGDQIAEAEEKKDTKKADELAKKMDDMSQKLGPEYIALMDGLQDMDPNSKTGQEISSTLEALDKLCAK